MSNFTPHNQRTGRVTVHLLDIPSFEAHLVRVAQAGVSPVIAGSMGEAIHLSRTERVMLIQTARKALNNVGLHTMPIIAGTGGGSTRETLELTKEAAAAGADYVLVIASGYFAGALAGDREALKTFWVEVSEKSPVPVMIYNCKLSFSLTIHFLNPPATVPGASGGIDLDSDLITDLAKECPNICGVKLTYVLSSSYWNPSVNDNW